MPTFSTDQLRDIARRILESAGSQPDEADIVAGELAEANLVGHDSHGIIRLKQYADYIEQGHIDPRGAVEIVLELPAMSVIDGHNNFGQLIASKALDVAFRGAKQSGAHTVFCRNCNHVGRVGSYTLKAARAGYVALMAVNGPGGGGTAPWGGLDRRLGTNPISMASPWGDDAILLDMTTSITAEGKIRVAHQTGETLAEGMIIDSAGRPTTNPADYYRDPMGAILPLGGAMGFKGYGMSVMLDVFGGILSGAGTGRKDLPLGTNGVWLQVIDVEQLMPREEFDAAIEHYVDWIKSSRKAPGIDEILMPGEIESRRREQRVRDGVEVPDGTWKQTCDLAERLGASLEGI